MYYISIKIKQKERKKEDMAKSKLVEANEKIAEDFRQSRREERKEAQPSGKNVNRSRRK